MKISRLFLSAFFLMLLVGCATEVPYEPSVNTISNANVSANIKRVADRRVETDQYLSQLLCLTEIRESQTNDGYKRIQIFLKNLSGSTYTIMYRFNWYDDNGVEVENPDNEMWIRKIIVAGDDLTLTSVAPRQNCKDFKLRLKAVY
jgi:uncharacterized protein YcfL